jgi:RNA polymerase sigma-70 factor (ECF subfamily)
VRRALGGDRAALDCLLARYRNSLRRMLTVRMDPRLKARVDPSDVIQSVLAEAAKKMVAYAYPPEQFHGWLRQLAWDELARLHRDHIKTKKRSVQLEEQLGGQAPSNASAVLLADRLAGRDMGPRSRLIRRESRDRVRRALAQLSPQDREVLELRFLEQLDVSDTASALGVSEAAVKSRQFRAVERLGRLLADLKPEGHQ